MARDEPSQPINQNADGLNGQGGDHDVEHPTSSMTAGNVVRIGTGGDLIDRLVKHYNNDDLQGVMIISRLKDGTFETSWTDTIGFCERIGLAECLKQNMMIKAVCPFEQED